MLAGFEKEMRIRAEQVALMETIKFSEGEILR